MSVRNLDALFAPRSVAVLGVSPRPGNLGGIVLRNLRAGGFRGPLWAVARETGEIDGLRICPGVAALPEAPELAVLCTPAATVPGLVAELGRRGTRAAIVITAGLRQPAAGGAHTLEQAMLHAARPHLLRILGPNCIGALVPGIGLNASFAPGPALAGQLAFVTQSGALATAMLDWANSRGIGFSHFVSLGDSADVDFGDVLDYLASDAGTRAILMYVESVQHARKFMSAARAAARNKPVILVKAGRAPEGARAAASHTGALAGSDAVFDAAVRRAGMVRVDTLQALFHAAETLAHARPWRGERLALITNGGGAGVLAADALALGQGRLAEFSRDTLQALDAVLPAHWSHGNPVDLIGDAPVERYLQGLRVLLDAPEVDGVLFMHAPTAIVPALEIAQACVPLLREAPKPVLTCWLGGRTVAPAREAFSAAGLSWYATPEHAVAAWLQLASYHHNQHAMLELPDAQPQEIRPDRSGAQAVLDEALRQGREWLHEAETKDLLQAYGIPTVPTRKVRDADEAVQAAAEIGYPVVLKADGRQLRVRPIRPEDGSRLAQFYAAASHRDLRLRFFLSRREVPHSELARYCQIDYEREMTFVALDGDRMAGEVRAVADPDNLQAEFAIQVGSGWQRRGLGRALLGRMLAYLRGRGTAEAVGQCLQENKGMAALARAFGFEIRPLPDGTMEMRLLLRAD